VHEFRAATLECNAGQCEVELLLTLFHNHYISIGCTKIFELGGSEKQGGEHREQNKIVVIGLST